MIDSNRRTILRHLDRHATFDRKWRQQAHEVLLALLNVRSDNPVEEWEDFTKVFQIAARSDALGLSGYIWPMKRTETVVRQWRAYRDLARAIAEARWPSDWPPIQKRFPQLYERATLGPFQKVEWGEIQRPSDLIWIALSLEKMMDIHYRHCAAPGCDSYAHVPFPKKRGPQPLYCELHDKDSRNVERHKEKRKGIDKKCLELLRKGLRSLPAGKRRWSSEQQRRALAARLYRITRKQLDKFPGHGPKWIGKQLRKMRGELNAKS